MVKDSGEIYLEKTRPGGESRRPKVTSFSKKKQGCQEEEELHLSPVTPVGGSPSGIFSFLLREEPWSTFSPNSNVL